MYVDANLFEFETNLFTLYPPPPLVIVISLLLFLLSAFYSFDMVYFSADSE